MKKKYIIPMLFLYISCDVYSQTQTLEWAIKKESPAQSKGLFSDINNNIYNYGDNFPDDMEQYNSFYANSLADSTGSYLQKFDSDGQLIYLKRWQNMFFSIKKIIYDGNQSLYFTGLFTGNSTVDGISISSKGGADGMVGKMNLSGTIQWVTTFGSGKEERGEGIAINPITNDLVVTGNISDSLYVNNTYVTEANQSTLIATFNTSGIFQDYKLYDFVSSIDNQSAGNYGKEIIYHSNGSAYLFTDREGAHWNGDTLVAPQQGRYLMKLDQNFDTLWTKFIIGPGCYYGWSGKNLRISANGDPYVLSHCYQHYGGNGYINRINPNNGSITWSDSRGDGGYTDLFMENNIAYTVGTEGANYCPCPDNAPGYQIVKIWDQNNIVVDTLKIEGYQIELTDITRNSLGQTFIAGKFYGSKAVVGNDTIVSDSANGIYYNSAFLARIGQGISTGIKESTIGSTQISIVPNPADGQFNLIFNKQTEQATCCIYDVMGNCILTKQISGSMNTKIDLSDYAKGIYFVQVTPIVLGKKEAAIFKKVIIQ